MAAERGISDQLFPELSDSNENKFAEQLKEVFERHQKMLNALKPKIYVAPEGWVLTAAIQHSIKHLDQLEKFSNELGEALNWTE